MIAFKYYRVEQGMTKIKRVIGKSYSAFRYTSRYGTPIYTFSLDIPADDDPFWDEHEFYVISIPKTASYSIDQYLDPRCSFGHLYGLDYPQRIRNKLRTIVRNPYDRLVSAYYFMIRGGFNNHPEYSKIRDNYNSFQDWVINGLTVDLLNIGKPVAYGSDTAHSSDKIAYGNMNGPFEAFQPQIYWLLDNKGEFVIDKEHICRFENLHEDVKRLMGITMDIHYNKSDAKDPDWRTYYKSEWIRNRVYSLYAKDFELLGYSRDISF